MKKLRVASSLLVSLLFLAALPGDLRAQETPGIALNQYHAPESGDAMMAVPAPWVGGHLVPRGGLTLDIATNPFVILDEDEEELATLVKSQVFLHLNANIALWDRLLVGLTLPIAVAQSGDSLTFGNQRYNAPDSAALGDLRLGLRGRLLGEYRDPFQLGVGANLFLPTGPDDNFTGEGFVYGQPMLLLGGRADYFVWSAMAGPIINGSDNPSTFRYGVGVGLVLVDEMLQIGPELFGAAYFEDSIVFEYLQRQSSVVTEGLFGAQLFLADALNLGAAAGTGFTKGLGSPDLRVLVRVAYAPRPEEEAPGDRDGDGIVDPEDACPDVPGVPNEDPAKHGCPPDRDGDGILDAVDACPDVPGVANEDPAKHGCPPEADRDGDGIVDQQDACPDVPGVFNEDPAKNGCPPDRDGDGIYDDKDACPDVPGVASEDPAKNGCPPDTDGDGIVDPEDACPNTPGEPNEDPTKNGCPKVRVTEEQIVITDRIEFDFGLATLRPSAQPILDGVAETMNKHPELELIEVQGHTDHVGGEQVNMILSQNRANAVMRALRQRGVVPTRLVAKGFGKTKPIATSETEEGRQKNRRVEFKILKRRKK